MKSKLVSIILPTFNRAHTLRRAIDSVYKQTYSDWELIIIDNNSTDGTEAIVEGYLGGRIKYFKINNEGIIAKSRNLGIKQSKGELIAFLDSDDWWSSNKLHISVREMMSFGADLVYHNLFKATNEKQIFYLPIRGRTLEGDIFNDLLSGGNCIPNSSVVVKKKIFSIVGYLCESPETNTWEDYDIWLRIAKYSNKIHKISNTMGYLWLGGDNESQGNSKNDALIRILKNINNFEVRYKKEISNNIYPPWWMDYQRGRSFYFAKRFEESLMFISKIKLGQVPFSYFFKILYMIAIVKYSIMVNKQ